MNLRDSLFWRTFALIVLIVALVSSTLLYFLHQHYHVVAQREAEAQAVFLASQCVKPVLWDDRLQLKALLSASVDQGAAGYAWLERDGAPLAHTFSQGVPKGLLDLDFQGRNKTSVHAWKDQRGQAFLDIAARLPHPANAVLHLGVTEENVNEGFATMLPTTALISLLSLALGAMLARLMANSITEETRTANQALEVSEQKFRTLADNTTDWEFWIGPDGRQIYNSPSCEHIIGYTREELDADPGLFARIVHPDDAALFAAHRHAACEDKQGGELELRIMHKNGEIRWISHRCRPVSGYNGECLGTRGANTDITERKEKETALQRSRDEIDKLLQRNQLLLNAAGEGIYGVDHAGKIIFINPVALTMLGLTEEEAMGRNAHALFHYHGPDGSAYPEAECPLYLTLQDAARRELEQSFIRKSGDIFPVHLVVTPMMDDARQVGAEVLFQDITLRKVMEAELTHLATIDSLTGVSNRRHFMAQMETEFARIQRFHEPAALLMLDLDHFKRINDSQGHAVGDAVLAALGATLLETLRKTDLVGRVGGEEFALLLPGTEAVEARQFAERLRERVAGVEVEAGGGRLAVTVSIGIASLKRDDASADAALARADDALYHAKENGRNRVEVSA